MDDTIGVLIGQVSRLLRRAFDERARRIGVTRPRWQLLVVVSRHPGINQGGVAEMLEVEPITVGRMVDRMQEAKLIERRADPSDRRTWRLHLTEKGQAQVKQLRPLGEDTLELSLEGIDAEHRKQLRSVLLVMRANLSRKDG